MTDYQAIREEIDRVTAAAADPRPEIVVRDALVEVTDEALAALVGWNRRCHDLYVRGRLLVQVAHSEAAERLKWLRRPAGAPVIVLLELEALHDRLDRAARWIQPARKKLVSARPPEWVARQIMKGRLSWPFPDLTGVIEAPTLRPDGTVLETPGYDETTGLLYVPNSEYPPVPEVDRRGVQDAVAALVEPVVDFPFVDNAARSAYLAAVLSLVARDAIDGCVPAFPIRAPVPASGKGLLAHVISTIGTGRNPAVTTYPGDDAELRKRITVFAIEGTPVVLVDNVTGTISSDQFAAALTAAEWTDRILGVSRLARAPLRTVWLLTGNNLRFGQTLGRRMVPIDIDPGVEHPEDRTNFHYEDLLNYVSARRPTLVVAGLAILRAYFRAGRPSHGKPPMGSYEGWDALIRGAIVWAGLQDPGATDGTSGRGRIRAEADEDLDTIDTLLVALTTAFSDDEFRVGDVLTKADGDGSLKNALHIGAANAKGLVTAKTLGVTFRTIRNRIVRGHKLVKVPRALGHPFDSWRVERAPSASSASPTGT